MEIKSPSVGKVLRLSVAPGTPLARGQEILVIESMKVEIPVKAPVAGLLKEFRVATGTQIQRGALLAIIEG
jgi:biotin carboxyl carrier protein